MNSSANCRARQFAEFRIFIAFNNKKRARYSPRRRFFAEPLVCKHPDGFRLKCELAFANAKRALFRLSPPRKKGTLMGALAWRRERDSNSRSVISRTHDFQSCALDQLSHLSVRLVYYITVHKKSQVFFSLFSKNFFIPPFLQY